jgi:hypothetical protein
MTRLGICSSDFLSFDQLVRKIGARELVPVVCQKCGFIAAGQEHCQASDRAGEWGKLECPGCRSTKMVEATADTMNEAFDMHYPWRRCEHCGFYFLFDDDVASVVEPDLSKVEPGTMGCPNCKKLTD